MAFTPITGDSGQSLQFLTASSTSIEKGDVLTFSSGYVQRAVAGTTSISLIADEDVTTGSGAHETISATLVNPGAVKIQALTSTTPAQSNVGTKVDLLDHNELNLAGTTTAVFFVTGIVNATDKLVEGYFVV